MKNRMETRIEKRMEEQEQDKDHLNSTTMHLIIEVEEVSSSCRTPSVPAADRKVSEAVGCCKSKGELMMMGS